MWFTKLFSLEITKKNNWKNMTFFVNKTNQKRKRVERIASLLFFSHVDRFCSIQQRASNLRNEKEKNVKRQQKRNIKKNSKRHSVFTIIIIIDIVFIIIIVSLKNCSNHKLLYCNKNQDFFNQNPSALSLNHRNNINQLLVLWEWGFLE